MVLQTRTAGSELGYNSALLTYTNESGVQTVAPLFHYELSRSAAQGVNVSSLWQWDLTGLGVSVYSLSFAANGPSLSFDSATLDTALEFTPAFAEQPFKLTAIPADLARWMYPFNGNPTGRPTASVFGSLGSSPDFDSRDAQYLLGFSTTNQIPTGRGATNYLVKRARLTLTIASGNQYAYSGTLRDYRSYFPTNDSRYVASASSSDTVDLFGVGFRGEYNPTNWGVLPDLYYTNRTAYAAGFDTTGVLVDVSNNVGDDGTNEIGSAFEIAPFAVGQTTNVAPGELMPVGSQLTFDLNLEDPLIYGYVQRGLNEGKLEFMATSLIAASFSGPPTYPNFYTIYSPIALPNQYPILDLEGEVVRPSVDNDTDGLPDDWENFYSGSLARDAGADADEDGANSSIEYRSGTDPEESASALRLSLDRRSGETEVRFPFAANRTYALQWSEDLKTWQNVSNAPVRYSSAWLEKKGTNPVYPSPVYAVSRDQSEETAHLIYRISAE